MVWYTTIHAAGHTAKISNVIIFSLVRNRWYFLVKLCYHKNVLCIFWVLIIALFMAHRCILILKRKLCLQHQPKRRYAKSKVFYLNIWSWYSSRGYEYNQELAFYLKYMSNHNTWPKPPWDNIKIIRFDSGLLLLVSWSHYCNIWWQLLPARANMLNIQDPH